jgi:hypothetical protein
MTSLLNLEAIWQFRQEELFKDVYMHAKDWNDKKRCSCMLNKKYEDELLICEHLKEDRERKFGKRIKKQFVDGDFISSRAIDSLLQ